MSMPHILNQNLFARYVDSVAQSVEGMAEPQWMEWTEGFSCLRSRAIQAGLFPTGFPIAICAGEDGFFGSNLKKKMSWIHLCNTNASCIANGTTTPGGMTLATA